MAKVPLRVVKILAESEQALLFDKNRGRHVLVEVGDTVGAYVVELIDEEDVTLTGRDQETVVLAGPDRPWRRDRRTADRPAPARAPAAATPADPYAPVAPYGDDLDEPVRSVSAAGIGAPAGAPAFDDAATPYDVPAVSMAAPPAPATIDASAPPAPSPAPAPLDASAPPSPAPATLDASPPPTPSVAPTTIPPTAPPAAAAPTAPPSVTPAAPATAAQRPAPPPPGPSPLAEALAAEAAGGAPAPLPPPSSGAPTVIPGGATATPATATAGTVTLPRREVDAALANFGTLAGSIRASFGKHGLELKTVAAGSLFARAGLRSGDVVTAVNGKPLRTLDDAADLYASAGSLRAATVQLRRGGKPQTLRIAIQ